MKNKYKILILVVSLILTVLTLATKNGVILNSKKNEVNFGITSFPFSSDPMDFDSYIHHYAFSSVYARLISTEKNGEFYPMLSFSWSNEDNFKTWIFNLRDDLNYSNGDKITANDVLLNFKRITFLKKKNASNSGLVEFFKGFNELSSIQDDIEGISLVNNKLILKFEKPMPNLLNVISFGFYGLAHPSLFNHSSGEWINKKKAISSSSYEVTKWLDSEFELSFRTNSRLTDNSKIIKKIVFKNFASVKNSEDLKTFDFLIADKQSLLVDDNYVFSGSSINLKIAYARCMSWNKSESPLHRLEVRKWFRSKFYEGLIKNGQPVTNSFFPNNHLGIKKVEESVIVEKPSFEYFTFMTHPILISGKIQENEKKISMANVYSDALASLGINSGANLVQKLVNDDNELDLVIYSTGIESEDFMDTARFMFLSKEGISLPDSNGKILKELKKQNPDINVINQELYDQAIIWPIRHYTNGFWFRKDSGINYDEINFDSPSIDFQFLKINN